MQVDTSEASSGNELLPPAGAHVVHFPGVLDDTDPSGFKTPPFTYYEGAPDEVADVDYWKTVLDPTKETYLHGVVLEDGMLAWGEHIPTHDILTAVTGKQRVAQFQAQWDVSATAAGPHEVFVTVDESDPVAADSFIELLQHSVSYPEIRLRFIVRDKSVSGPIPLQSYKRSVDI